MNNLQKVKENINLKLIKILLIKISSKMQLIINIILIYINTIHKNRINKLNNSIKLYLDKNNKRFIKN